MVGRRTSLAALGTAAVLTATPAGATAAPVTPAPTIQDGSAQRALAVARVAFKRSRIRHYTWQVKLVCRCDPALARGTTVRVTDGKANKVAPAVRGVATVQLVFATIQTAIADGFGVLDVRFTKAGVPTRVIVDRDPSRADGELAISFHRFRPRK